MKKRMFIVVSFTIIIAIAISLIFATQGRRKKTKVCKVGILYPITGDASYWGENARNGALLALKVFLSKRKVNKCKIIPVIEDSKSNPKYAVSAVNKLIYQDKIRFLVGDLVSSNLLAILPIVNKNRILTIGQGSSPLLKKAGDYVFRTYPSDDLQGKVIADFLRSFLRASAERTGILYINNEYGKGIENILIHEMNSKLKVVEGYPPGTKDFRGIIYKALNSDVLVIAGYPEDVPVLLKQLNETGFKGIIVGTETFENKNIKKLSQLPLSYSIFYSLPKLGSMSDPVVRKFRETYYNTYHREPGVPADMAYDAMMLILKGIDSMGCDPDRVREFLSNIKNYHGASGIISFDRYGDVIKPFVVKSIKKGKSEVVWEWHPKEKSR